MFIFHLPMLKLSYLSSFFYISYQNCGWNYFLIRLWLLLCGRHIYAHLTIGFEKWYKKSIIGLNLTMWFPIFFVTLSSAYNLTRNMWKVVYIHQFKYEVVFELWRIGLTELTRFMVSGLNFSFLISWKLADFWKFWTNLYYKLKPSYLVTNLYFFLFCRFSPFMKRKGFWNKKKWGYWLCLDANFGDNSLQGVIIRAKFKNVWLNLYIKSQTLSSCF